MRLRHWLAQLKRRLTSPLYRLDISAEPASTAEIERLLRELREAWETLGLTIAVLDGTLAVATGRTPRDNPYPRDSSHWHAWQISWFQLKGSCENAGSSRTPSQDNGATSGSHWHVS